MTCRHLPWLGVEPEAGWPTPPGPAWSGRSPTTPAYYFPVQDVRADLLVPSATVTHPPSRGDAQHFTIKAGGKQALDAALRYVDSPSASSAT